jgi:hypothetical protein
MSRNPWLAIDAATPPRERARDLRREWERFLDDRSARSVRRAIVLSWERSQAAGVDPTMGRVAPQLWDQDEVAARWEVHPLARAVPLIQECLGDIIEEAQQLLVVSDPRGLLLWIDGDPQMRWEAAEMNFVEGSSWSESHSGTNAVGTALAAEHAVQVFAAEHFKEVVHAWTCAAAPVHDPDTGQLIAIIDLTGRAVTASPHTFGSVVATARAVEAQLRADLEERHTRLRARYGELVAGGRALLSGSGRVLGGLPGAWLDAERVELPPGGGELRLPSGAPAFAEPVGHGEAFLVRVLEPPDGPRPSASLKLNLLGEDRPLAQLDGRSVRLTRRHAEILGLLVLCGAMTSEALAAELYGDAGRPVAARVEISRLRKLLGRGIEAEPYRLAMEVECDVALVRSLLDRGDFRAAAERYRAPILPRSEAPGIVREREALDNWVRHAVLTAGDPLAIWAWVQSASGQDDLPAWKRLVAELDFADPRRSLAAAQVKSLRARFDPP